METRTPAAAPRHAVTSCLSHFGQWDPLLFVRSAIPTSVRPRSQRARAVRMTTSSKIVEQDRLDRQMPRGYARPAARVCHVHQHPPAFLSRVGRGPARDRPCLPERTTWRIVRRLGTKYRRAPVSHGHRRGERRGAGGAVSESHCGVRPEWPAPECRPPSQPECHRRRARARRGTVEARATWSAPRHSRTAEGQLRHEGHADHWRITGARRSGASRRCVSGQETARSRRRAAGQGESP